MPSYLVTGVTQGLGFEFLTQISQDPNNKVIGLVRRKAATLEKIAGQLPDRKNIEIVEADLTDHKSLYAAAENVSRITGGAIDYLIASAGYISHYSGYLDFADLATDPAGLDADLLKTFQVNVFGQIHLFNAFMPLVLKGQGKKVIAISSGHADISLIKDNGVGVSGPYAISKTALNATIAKFHAKYAPKGVLFMAVCPGVFATDRMQMPVTEREQENGAKTGAQFARIGPAFTGPASVDVPAAKILELMGRANLAAGYGGMFLSHMGLQTWLPVW
ncbi:short chain dehydrogenase domain-containing protein [Sarocladium implicatum]|nr:short chain dehydrogenase domain-containing protein [Sarocladium implicatum]